MKLNLLGKGFERREDLDFKDDGNTFRAYTYKGMPITYTTDRGEYFLSVRIDYYTSMNNLDITYYDYTEKDWYLLADEFNGSYEVDVNKLIENIEIILKGISELVEEVKKSTIDYEAYADRADLEINQINDILKLAENINIMNYSEYDLRTLKNRFDSLKDERDRIIDLGKSALMGTLNRYKYQNFVHYGYISFRIEKDYYYENIMKILNK